MNRTFSHHISIPDDFTSSSDDDSSASSESDGVLA